MPDNIYSWAYDGDIEKVRAYLQECDATKLAEEGADILSNAVCGGQIEVVELLLQAGVELDAFGSGNTNALLEASEKGDAQMVERFLQAGADVNIRDPWESSPLLKASRSGAMECVRLLLEHGAEVNAVDKYEHTVLTQAVRSGNVELVRFWLDRGADVNAQKIDTLSLACSIESREMVELLLKAGAKAGDSLFYAKFCSRAILELLIEAGADVNARDIQGNTPLASYVDGYGVSDEHDENVEFLLQAGAEVDVRCGYWERTPLMLAIEHSRKVPVKALLAHGAEVNAVDKKGKSALVYALGAKDEEIVDILLAAGADVNTADQEGKTPLMYAAELKKNKLFKTLVNAGAGVDACDAKGETALMYAVRQKHAAGVKALLKLGADPGICTKSKTTALSIARWNGYDAIAQLLESAGTPGMQSSKTKKRK